MKSSSLSIRLMLTMFIVGTAPLVAAGGLLYYYQSRAKINTLALHESLSAVTATTIQQYLLSLTGRMAFTEILELSPRKIEKTRSQLGQALIANPDFLVAMVLDKSGKQLVAVGRPRMEKHFGAASHGNDAVFMQAVQTGQVVFSSFDSLGGVPVCSLVFPINKETYLYAVINAEPLWRQFQEQRIGRTGRIFLTDGHGRLFRFSGDNPPQINPDFLLHEFTAGPSARLDNIPTDEGAFVGAFKRVPQMNLYVTTLQARGEAFWDLRLTMSIAGLLLLSAAIASYIISLRYADKLSGPVIALIDGASRVARKDFDTPVKDVKSLSEFRSLIFAFNSMMSGIGRYSRIQVDKLLEEKHKMDVLVGMMRDGVILADEDRQPVFMNGAAQELLKDPQFHALALGDKGETARQFCAEGPESGHAYCVQLSSGTRWFRIMRQQLQPAEGGKFFLIVLRDVTLEREMDAVKEEFFNSVAHDLRAPLLGMQGYMRMMEASCTDPKSKENIYSMKVSSKRVFSLVEDILDIARMESGALRLKREKFDFEECVSRAVISLAPLVADKKISLSVELLPGASREFSGDSRMIERVLINLVSNSIKYTPVDGKIIVSYGTAGDTSSVSVKDSGPGIPPDRLEDIFEKYHRADNTPGGYGLGLATARRIEELHGGKIHASNIKDGGAEFVFAIPASQPDESASPQKS